jgi:hypothetical protein
MDTILPGEVTMETELDNSVKIRKSPWLFSWIPAILLKPRATIQMIDKEQKHTWLTPLVVLSVMAVLVVIVAAPIRRNAIQMGLTTPPDFQYYSADQQAQFYTAQATQTSPLFMYVFPVLFGLLAIWLSWFILGSVLHLVLTLSGSRAVSVKSYNMVGWAMVPLGVRYLVQIIAMIITRSTINGAGLSGLVSAEATGVAAYLAALLGLIDIFFIWEILLLIMGTRDYSGLARKKALSATLISLFIFMIIFALPGFLQSILSTLSFTRYYFF